MSGEEELTALNWRFEKVFKIPSVAMYINRAHPFIKRNTFWLCQFIYLIVVNAIVLYTLCNSIFAHDIKGGNYTDASKNCAMLIICFNSNIKYYTMLYHRESVADLIRTIDRDYNLALQFEEKEKNIIISNCRKATKVCKFWLVIAFCTGMIFPGKACYLMAYYFWKGEAKLVPMFDLTLPYFIERHKDSTWIFCGFFCLCLMFDAYASIVFAGFEPLIPIFCLHTCGQLELLSLRINTAITESKNVKEIEGKFKNIIMKLQEMYSFVNQVQNNFMMLMEFNMKSTTIILPFTAFQIIEDFRTQDIINVDFIVLLIAATLHFFTPCYFSDFLMETSEKFRQAIYSCGWETCKHSEVRKTVLFMITRAAVPFGITTVFYDISLDTFAAMCRQSYGLFNLMISAWT